MSAIARSAVFSGQVPVHPVAALFPMLPEDELQQLADDIRANGLHQPVVVQAGILLDGRNRLEACARAEVDPIPAVEYEGQDAAGYILSANARRRDMNTGQRAMVADSLATMTQGARTDLVEYSTKSLEEAAHLLKVHRATVAQAREVRKYDVALAEQVWAGLTTLQDALREVRKVRQMTAVASVAAREAGYLQGLYDVIVMDPPWPMAKIERDVRPAQVAFDYPTMTEEELAALSIPAADNCHLWVWTTQKHLPLALHLLDRWGLTYVCTFVWHKPGGFQPFGLPQYNAEFVLYARRGSPQFADTHDFNVCFQAPRGRHSEKPDVFYEMVRRVTAGRRLDMFSRRQIEGFDGWGKEAAA